ncbi:hypothetical protein EYF80_041020 [Liparis tanakae]|uniref:Uncharacterized protein n=1 Tax=Liparis tanakae TaxID=230148 RepID=A0A4Z2G6A7_9TELE|nr:hypothetical protein EYF80_041020 [Liparis tanakae]
MFRRTDLVQHAQDVLLALSSHHGLRFTNGADVEPRLEAAQQTGGQGVVKDFRQKEVEEGPELGQVVLQRRAGQQQLVVGRQQLQLPHQPAVEVFDPVALVHYQSSTDTWDRRETLVTPRNHNRTIWDLSHKESHPQVCQSPPTSGVKRLNSLIQLGRVERGATTRKGPITFFSIIMAM